MSDYTLILRDIDGSDDSNGIVSNFQFRLQDYVGSTDTPWGIPLSTRFFINGGVGSYYTVASVRNFLARPENQGYQTIQQEWAWESYPTYIVHARSNVVSFYNDTIAPTVSSFTPGDGATGVLGSSNFVLTFNEAIQRGAGVVQIREGSAAGTIVESFDAATSTRLTISGSTLTIDPITNLVANGLRYFVTLDSGAIKDLAGNNYSGVNTYDITTVDTIAPTVSSFTPIDGATGVLGSSNFVLIFNEAIQRGTGVVQIREGSATGTVVESFDAATSTRLTISGSTLTIDPITNLVANGLRYFVTLDSGAIKDLAGNNYSGVNTYDITTVDTIAPTVNSFTPIDGATGVLGSSNFVLTFNEAIQRGAGVVQIREGSAAGTIVESFDAATSTRLTISGSTLTIDPANNLLENRQYFVTLDSGAIKDLAGNNYSGVNTYDITTVDTIAPTVSSFTPIDGATGVLGSSNFVLIFNEAIQRGAGNIRIREGSAAGTIVESFDAATSTRLTISGSTLTIDPTNNLLENRQYFVTLDSGSIQDSAGNNYSGVNTYDITIEAIPPTVNSFTPGDGATGVLGSSNFVLTFNEAIQRGTGVVQIREGSATGTVVESFDAATSTRLTISGSTLTIDPANNLLENRQYFVTLDSGAIKDLAGNNYSGVNTYDITTVDTIAPTVNSFTPGDGATGVLGSSNFVLIFNEAIQRGAGNIRIREGSAAGTIVESFDAATSTRLTISGSTLTIDPTNNLLENRQYFVTLDSGSIQDSAGNNYSGVNTYDITIEAIPPTVNSFTPGDGATGVLGSSNFVLTFNEAIQRGTGVVQIREGSATGTVVESFDAATSTRLTISGSTLTIDPITNLVANGSRYFVTLDSGVIKDLAGNNNSGVNTYDITTVDLAPPNISFFDQSGSSTSFLKFTLSEANSVLQNKSGVTLVTANNIPVPIIAEFWSVNIQDGTLVVALSTWINKNQTYYLKVAAGSIVDRSGNAIPSTQFSFNYETIAPTVNSFTPIDGATGVLGSSNFVLTFNEAIQRGTGVVQIREGSATGTVVESFDAATSTRLTISGSTLTIDPANNLLENRQYFVTLDSGVIKDLAGNNYSGVNTYDITTVDTIAPTVNSFTPGDGATGVLGSSNFVLIFNEAIQRGAGNIRIREGSAAGTIVESFDAATSTRLTISGSTLTIDPTNNLLENRQYFVTLDSGSIQDSAGNNYSGVNTYDITAAAQGINLNTSPAGTVTITGTSTQGQALTAANTLEDLDGLGVITYQWRADGSNISGATSSSLTLNQAHVGKAITVVASYTDLLGTVENMISNPTSAVAGLVAPPTYAATFQIPVSSIQSIGLSPDGQFLIIKMGGVIQSVATGSTMSFNGQAISTADLTQTMAPTPVFQSTGGAGGFTLPDIFTGPASLNLQYQLIESADNAVVIGSQFNDFIKVASANSIGKAVNGGGGNDVIDGGVGSTFVTGGGTTANSSTYFLDGRAPGTSWSTITDFKLDVDKATIWGFVRGVSSVDASFTNFNSAGAGGYEGLTLHFKNLLPSGQTSGTNANLNSITLSGRTLQEFGASSLAELNNQINNQTNPNFLVGATQDSLGTHGYLFIN